VTGACATKRMIEDGKVLAADQVLALRFSTSWLGLKRTSRPAALSLSQRIDIMTIVAAAVTSP